MTELKKTGDIVAMINSKQMQAQIRAALPRHLTPERMIRVVTTALRKTPALLQCTQESLLGAIVTASQLGLEPDGVLGHAYLIPYGKTCTFIPGYKGLIHLARQSGHVSTIQAHVVREGDRFDYAFGLSPKMEHVPAKDGAAGAVTYAYAIAHLKDGGVQWDVMSRAEIDAIRSRSRAGNSGPWVTDFEEMAKKTVLRRMCKLLPVSVELQRAVALDERAEVGMDQELPTVNLGPANMVPPEDGIDPELMAEAEKCAAEEAAKAK